MDNLFGWAGIAALGGLFGACWGYLRGFYRQAISRVILSFECHDSARDCVLAYCNHRLTPSVFGSRVFVGWADYVRPRRRRELVACETIGQDGKLYWMGWRPIWVTRTSPTTSNQDNTNTIAKPVKMQTFRGGFSIEQFVQAAFDFVNDSTCTDLHGPGDRVRFNVEYHSGSVGKLSHAMLNSNAPQGDVRGGPHGSAAYQLLEKMSWKYLKWTPNDLGTPKKNSDLSLLSLSEPVLKFTDTVKNWLHAKAWFQARGLPWKLGALFYGPPGNGKTSVVRALGVELDLPVHVFDLSSMLNEELRNEWQRMANDLPAIALLDDIDCVFDGREPRPGVKLTLEQLLSVMDGVERADGLLVIMTTNRPECLCDALAGPTAAGEMPSRPGRIDMSLEFGPPDEAGRRLIASRILQDWPELIEEAVVAGVKDSGAQFERRCIDIAGPRLMVLLPALRAQQHVMSEHAADQLQLITTASRVGVATPHWPDNVVDQFGPADATREEKRACVKLGLADGQVQMHKWANSEKGMYGN